MSENRGIPWLFIFGLTLYIPLQAMLSGFLFSHMWTWFAVGPLGAPPLRVVDAIGICFMVSAFLMSIQRTKKDNWLDHFLVPVLNNLVVFAMSWVVHLFQ